MPLLHEQFSPHWQHAADEAILYDLPESASSTTKAASVGARNVTPSAGAGTAAGLVASSVFTICRTDWHNRPQHKIARNWSIARSIAMGIRAGCDGAKAHLSHDRQARLVAQDGLE